MLTITCGEQGRAFQRRAREGESGGTEVALGVVVFLFPHCESLEQGIRQRGGCLPDGIVGVHTLQ